MIKEISKLQLISNLHEIIIKLYKLEKTEALEYVLKEGHEIFDYIYSNVIIKPDMSFKINNWFCFVANGLEEYDMQKEDNDFFRFIMDYTTNIFWDADAHNYELKLI